MTYDKWSKVIDRVLNILLVRYPERTSIGLILGGVFAAVSVVLRPALSSVEWADFAALPWWGWLPMGVVLCHWRTIGSMFKQTSVGDERADLALRLIAEGNFTPAERRQHHRRLLEKYIDEVSLSRDIKGRLRELERSVAPDVSSQGKP